MLQATTAGQRRSPAMRLPSLLTALLLTACAAANFPPLGETDANYAATHQFFAEYCALSQIKKRPGFGADIRGEIGGHAVFYLQGACRDPDQAYPVLRLCEQGGVGLSVNAHFRNAKWAAIPGRDFFFQGNVAPGAPGALVTRQTYAEIQRQARSLGLYDGIAFHEAVFADMPQGWSREAWKYEVSIGTDYAVGIARGRYCARIPVDRPAMRRMIDFLNAQNAPYRAGAVFHWSVFSDNCIHLAHNALAAAGLWDPWPINRPFLISLFDFPVPRNEFVNLMRRANDDLPPDPAAAYDDAPTRRALLRDGVFPSRPGALAESRPPLAPNDVYEGDLKLIFYDDPLFGQYRRRFDDILAEPRYTDPAANRAYFATAADRALAERKPLAAWLAKPPYAADPATFAAIYQRYYEAMSRLADRSRPTFSRTAFSRTAVNSALPNGVPR